MPNLKIKKIKGADNIELGKRVYAPFIVSANCPECGQLVENDLTGDYMMYPRTGVPFDLPFYCFTEKEDADDVEHTWTETVFVRLVVSKD